MSAIRMTATRRQTIGGDLSSGALDARSYSTQHAGEIHPTAYAIAREVGIAVSVALFCAVPVGIVIVSRLWSLSQF